MIPVHHLNNSRAQRILRLLEELGCEYEPTRYQRDPRTRLAPVSAWPRIRSASPKCT